VAIASLRSIKAAILPILANTSCSGVSSERRTLGFRLKWRRSDETPLQERGCDKGCDKDTRRAAKCPRSSSVTIRHRPRSGVFTAAYRFRAGSITLTTWGCLGSKLFTIRGFLPTSFIDALGFD